MEILPQMILVVKTRTIIADSTKVISLARSITDYEGLQQLCAQTKDLLVSALESVRQYAVETDPTALDNFRAYLTVTIKNLHTYLDARDSVGVDRTRAEIRAQMRDYRDRSARYLDHLRNELHNTSKALTDLLATCQSSSGAEQKLNEQIVQVRALESASGMEDVRQSARRIAITIAQCAEELKREKDGVILQLRDEIRTLQTAVENAQRAARLDDVTGCFNREELERLIKRQIVAGHPFTVMHLWLRNFDVLRNMHSVGIMDQLAIAFSKRVTNIAKEPIVLGRWRTDVFCLVCAAGVGKSLGPALLRQCAGPYVCLDNGTSRQPKLQLTVTHLDPKGDDDVDSFVRRIESLAEKQ